MVLTVPSTHMHGKGSALENLDSNGQQTVRNVPCMLRDGGKSSCRPRQRAGFTPEPSERAPARTPHAGRCHAASRCVCARVRLGTQSLCSLKHAAASEAGSIRRTRCSVHWEPAVPLLHRVGCLQLHLRLPPIVSARKSQSCSPSLARFVPNSSSCAIRSSASGLFKARPFPLSSHGPDSWPWIRD